MIHVAILDDHSLIRQGIRTILADEEDISVVAELESPEKIDQVLESISVDVLITDLSFKQEMSGFDVIQLVKSRYQSCRILVISMHSGAEQVQRAMQSGADGYLSKESSLSLIAKAVRRTFQGECFLQGNIFRSETGDTGNGSKKTLLELNIYEALSAREVEIFKLLGEGETSHRIAEILCISPSTVGTHRDRIKHKLGIDSLVQLRFLATQWILNNQ